MKTLTRGSFRWKPGLINSKGDFSENYSQLEFSDGGEGCYQKNPFTSLHSEIFEFFFLVRSDRRGKKGLHLLHQARTTQKLSFASVVIRKLAGGLGQMLYSRYIRVLIFMYPECHSFREITTDSGWNYNHLLVY